eukprot:515257-Prymnesium_polylepis.2
MRRRKDRRDRQSQCTMHTAGPGACRPARTRLPPAEVGHACCYCSPYGATVQSDPAREGMEHGWKP